jgi:transcriptional regulator with XRE-family HTH domain
MAKKTGLPDIRERFGDAVRTRREKLGLTQEDLAEKAGIHRTYLSDVERGSRNVSLVNIERLARTPSPLSIPHHTDTTDALPAGAFSRWTVHSRPEVMTIALLLL